MMICYQIDTTENSAFMTLHDMAVKFRDNHALKEPELIDLKTDLRYFGRLCKAVIQM